MSKIVAIARGSVALKLSLAGVRVEEASDAKAAEKLLEDHLEQNDAQVVVVEEQFREQFSEWFSEQLRRHKGSPLVVYCPSFEEEESNVDAYLSSVLKPAVGFEIRLE